MSGKLSLIFGRPNHMEDSKIYGPMEQQLQCMLGFYYPWFSRLVDDWSVEDMTPDVTLCRMLLDVSV